MAYLFLLPLLAFYLTFTLWPLLRSVWLSFTDYEFLDPRSGDFVGLANYAEWLKDPAVPETLWIAVQLPSCTWPPAPSTPSSWRCCWTG